MNVRHRSTLVRSTGGPLAVFVACALSTLATPPPAESAEVDVETALRAGVEPRDLAELLEGPRAAVVAPVRGVAIVPASLITRAGLSVAGLAGPVSAVNTPFTNGLGVVGFTGTASDGAAGQDNFVWSGSGVQFVDSSVVGLSGAESTMGTGDAGQFIYSPSASGNDAVWTHNGLLLAATSPAPGFPVGTVVTFNSRPTMRPNGQAYWVAGFNESGGTTTQGRMVYTSSAATPGTISVVLRSDDIVNAIPIARPSGIAFDYAFSDNGAHHIQSLLLATGSTANDDFVYVDGTGIAREGAPNGTGDNWAAFDNVTINNQGDYMFSGDSSGTVATDEFITYGDLIVLREGAVLDGQPLTTPATVQALSINNLDHAAHIWSIAGGTELLFFSCNAADLATGSSLLLATGDSLDLDGNGTGDVTVTDFNASNAIGPGLSLAEDESVYVDVDIDPVNGPFDSVIRLTAPECDFLFSDGFEEPIQTTP